MEPYKGLDDADLLDGIEGMKCALRRRAEDVAQKIRLRDNTTVKLIESITEQLRLAELEMTRRRLRRASKRM